MAGEGFREDDDHESLIATGVSAARNCVIALMRDDAETFTVMAAGQPVAMFGIVPISEFGWGPEWAVAWFLATPSIYHVKEAFLQQCPLWIDHLQRHYPKVVNWVYPGNKAGVKWAKFLGFEFLELEDYGVEPGHKFWRVVRSV